MTGLFSFFKFLFKIHFCGEASNNHISLSFSVYGPIFTSFHQVITNLYLCCRYSFSIYGLTKYLKYFSIFKVYFHNLFMCIKKSSNIKHIKFSAMLNTKNTWSFKKIRYIVFSPRKEHIFSVELVSFCLSNNIKYVTSFGFHFTLANRILSQNSFYI